MVTFNEAGGSRVYRSAQSAEWIAFHRENGRETVAVIPQSGRERVFSSLAGAEAWAEAQGYVLTVDQNAPFEAPLGRARQVLTDAGYECEELPFGSFYCWADESAVTAIREMLGPGYDVEYANGAAYILTGGAAAQ